MPVDIQGAGLLLSKAEVDSLWREVISRRDFADELVNVRWVSRQEIQELNKRYRKKDRPTNVLTFNYGGEHDIALCLDVAREEAIERGIQEKDYAALLLTHAFLHVAGVDHEKSEEEASAMAEMEREILSACGFESKSL